MSAGGVVDVTDPAHNVPIGGADAYEPLRELFAKHGGAVYLFGAEAYYSRAPIPYDPGTRVVGLGSSPKAKEGTLFRPHDDADAGEWAGCGFFTSRGYMDDVELDRLGEQVGFQDFCIDGLDADFVNGILVGCCAEPDFRNLRFRDLLGAEPMPARGSGVSKRSGSFQVCLTTWTIEGRRGASADNPNDPLLADLRTFGCNGPLLWTDDGEGSTITDGCMRWSNPLVQTFLEAIGDQGVIDIQHAGGWSIAYPHLNGAGGNGIVLGNANATAVSDGWLDGFGCGGVLEDAACLKINATSGGADETRSTAVTVWGNRVRWREEQAAGGTFLDFNARDVDVALAVFGNAGFAQSARVDEARAYLMALRASEGSIAAAITGNTFIGADGAPWPLERVYRELDESVRLFEAGNSWNG